MGEGKFTIVADGNISTSMVYLGSDGELYRLTPDGAVYPGPLTSRTGDLHKNDYPEWYFSPIDEDEFFAIPRLWSSFLVDFPEKEFPELFEDVKTKANKERQLNIISTIEQYGEGGLEMFIMDDRFNTYAVADDLIAPKLPFVDVDVSKNISFYSEAKISPQIYKAFVENFSGNQEQRDYLLKRLIPFMELTSKSLTNPKIPKSIREKIAPHLDVSSGRRLTVLQNESIGDFVFSLVQAGDLPFISVPEPGPSLRENVLHNAGMQRHCYVPLSDREAHLKRFAALTGMSVDDGIELYDTMAFQLARESRKYNYHVIPKKMVGRIDETKRKYFIR